MAASAASQNLTAANIRLAVQMKRSEITDILSRRPFEIRQILRPIFTPDESTQIAKECDYHGSIGQAKMIIDKILRKSDSEVEDFLNIVQGFDEEPDLYSVIEGNMSMGDTAIKKISSYIRRVYKERNCHLVKSLPGEEFILNLNKHDYVMQLDFTAVKLQTEHKKLDLLPKKALKLEYENVSFDSIDDMVSSLHKDEQSDSILALGIAGCGKTILARQLLCLWVNEGKELQDFDLVIVIPVRDINVTDSVMDIIGEGDKSLGLVNKETKEILHLLMVSETSSIVIIIDGVDEVEIPESSELFEFIIGKKYRNVKKVITARPEALLLSVLDQKYKFCPTYKVEIYGTNKSGVYKYLKDIISAEDKNIETKEIDELIAKCERDMGEFELLLIPLYLTLLGFLFTTHWAEHCSFSDFKVPHTLTDLFNAFMHVILRIWLQRTGQHDLAQKLKFTINPITDSSNLPRDMKKKLVAIGQISYDFLLMQKYAMKEMHLKKYLIDPEDIRACGMFCISEVGSIEFFYTHKLLQEYMAAVYLSHAQFREHSFRSLVDREETLLQERFHELLLVLCFLFGLEPDFVMEVIVEIFHKTTVEKNRNGEICLDYESSLYKEINGQELKEMMTNFLCVCRPVEASLNFEAHNVQIYNLCKAFNIPQKITLFREWFNLHIDQGENNELVIANQPSQKIASSLFIDNFNLLCVMLLSDLTFPNITKLDIKRSCTTDMEVLQQVFPKLQIVYNTIENTALSSLDNGSIITNNCNPQYECSITDIILEWKSEYVSYRLPPSCVTSFQKQSQLQSLRIKYVDILSEMDDIQKTNWPHLNQLEMYLKDIKIYDLETLFALMNQTTSLRSLTLSNNYLSHLKDSISSFVVKHLNEPYFIQLRELRLFGMLQQKGITQVCKVLPAMTNLDTLGLSHNEVMLSDGENNFTPNTQLMQVLIRCPHITDLHMGYATYVTNAIRACKQFSAYLKSKGILTYLKLGVYDCENLKYMEFLQDESDSDDYSGSGDDDDDDDADDDDADDDDDDDEGGNDQDKEDHEAQPEQRSLVDKNFASEVVKKKPSKKTKTKCLCM